VRGQRLRRPPFQFGPRRADGDNAFDVWRGDVSELVGADQVRACRSRRPRSAVTPTTIPQQSTKTTNHGTQNPAESVCTLELCAGPHATSASAMAHTIGTTTSARCLVSRSDEMIAIAMTGMSTWVLLASSWTTT
jgi:hypothetical protein